MDLQAQIDYQNKLLTSRLETIRAALRDTGGDQGEATGLTSTATLLRAYEGLKPL